MAGFTPKMLTLSADGQAYTEGGPAMTAKETAKLTQLALQLHNYDKKFFERGKTFILYDMQNGAPENISLPDFTDNVAMGHDGIHIDRTFLTSARWSVPELYRICRHELAHENNNDLYSENIARIEVTLRSCKTIMQEFEKDPVYVGNVFKKFLKNPQQLELYFQKFLPRFTQLVDGLSKQEMFGMNEFEARTYIARYPEQEEEILRNLALSLNDSSQIGAFDRKKLEIFAQVIKDKEPATIADNSAWQNVDVSEKIREGLSPLAEKADLTTHFMHTHARATEYRADAAATDNGLNINDYIQALRKILVTRLREDDPKELAEELTDERHPKTADRIAYLQELHRQHSLSARVSLRLGGFLGKA